MLLLGGLLLPGESTVEFRCAEETNLVLIHSNKLNYTSQSNQLAQLRGLTGAQDPVIVTSWLEPTTQYLVIQLQDNLVKNASYVLSTIFRGELADDLGGFYRSEYTENGQTK